MVKVLLIEDNPGDVELVRKRLLAAGAIRFTLTVADTLADGIGAHSEQPGDVVLLDLNLPDSSGLQTIEDFRERAPGAAVVVLTGTTDLDTAVEALRRGADDYVCKADLSTDLLPRTIRYAIERRRMIASLEQERRTVAMLQDVGTALASELDHDRLVQKITDIATRLVGAAFGAVSLTYRGDGPVRIDDVRLDPRYETMAADHGMPAGHTPVVSYLAIPVVLRHGGVGGGLLFGHPEPARFRAEHEALAVGIAGWAALAMQNARLYDEAVRASQSRENLLHVVSHDLRNHVNVMQIGLFTLRASAAGETLRRFGAVERGAAAMRRLLEDLVDAAAMEKGVLSVEPEWVDLQGLLEETRLLLAPSIESKGILQEWSPTAVGVLVWADRERILQVLGNLIGNAVKFTPAGGRVSVTATVAHDEVLVAVEDSGPGIPKDHHPRIFERFFRGPRPGGQGAGLGLAIARALVDAHGGRIWVESEMGIGTTFRFTLRRRA